MIIVILKVFLLLFADTVIVIMTVWLNVHCILQTPKRTDHRQVPAIWNRVSLHKLNKDFFIYLFFRHILSANKSYREHLLVLWYKYWNIIYLYLQRPFKKWITCIMIILRLFLPVKRTSCWILKTVQTIKTFKQKKFWIVSLGKDMQGFLQFFSLEKLKAFYCPNISLLNYFML